MSEQNQLAVLPKDKIKLALKEVNITDEAIEALKESCKGLKLKTLDDKETYLLLKEQSKLCVKLRNAGVKVFKAFREEAVRKQKESVAEEKVFVARIDEFESVVDYEIDLYENNIKQKEQAELQRKEDQYIERTQTLVKLGAIFGTGSFILGGVAIEANLIKLSSEEVWSSEILPTFEAEYSIIEAKKIEEEAEKAKERLKLEEDKKALQEAQEKLRKQQQETADATAKIEREEKERLAQMKADKEKADLQLHNARFQTLFPFSTPDSPQLTNLHLLDENEFAKEYEAMKSAKEIYDKIVEEVKQKKIIERLKEERLEEEVIKLENLAKSTDKVKWAAFEKSVNDLFLPDFKSRHYKSKASEAIKLIEQIKAL